jgi:hypothetical protein
MDEVLDVIGRLSFEVVDREHGVASIRAHSSESERFYRTAAEESRKKGARILKIRTRNPRDFFKDRPLGTGGPQGRSRHRQAVSPGQDSPMAVM